MSGRYLNLTQSNELPGFYRDPTTGRYFTIPVNPSTYIPNFFADTSINNARDKSSFNRTLIQIKIGRGFRKQNVCLPAFLYAQQNGSVSAEDLASVMLKLKLRQLENAHDINHKEGFKVRYAKYDTLRCQFVICSESSNIVSLFCGVTLIFEIKREFRNRTDDSSPTHVVTYFPERYITRIEGAVVHMCPAKVDDQKYFLTCANGGYYSKSVYQLFPFDDQSGSLPTYEVKNPFALRCCVWNSKQKMAIIGTENDVLIRKIEDDADHYLKFPHRDHKAIELSDDGDVILTVSSNGKLVGRDLRTNDASDIARIGRGVEYMKLLRNGYTLISSGFDNKLSNVDLRMGKVVFRYPGFNNQNRRIPFTYDETWNVLCSPGQDNVTRYWDLLNGEPLASLNPPLKSPNQLHSVLTVRDNVLTTDIFVYDQMFCYQPLSV